MSNLVKINTAFKNAVKSLPSDSQEYIRDWIDDWINQFIGPVPHYDCLSESDVKILIEEIYKLAYQEKISIEWEKPTIVKCPKCGNQVEIGPEDFLEDIESLCERCEKQYQLERAYIDYQKALQENVKAIYENYEKALKKESAKEMIARIQQSQQIKAGSPVYIEDEQIGIALSNSDENGIVEIAFTTNKYIPQTKPQPKPTIKKNSDGVIPTTYRRKFNFSKDK